MPRGSRFEWQAGRLGPATEGPWVCDCAEHGLVPEPDHIGQCATCFRPVYDENGRRITT